MIGSAEVLLGMLMGNTPRLKQMVWKEIIWIKYFWYCLYIYLVSNTNMMKGWSIAFFWVGAPAMSWGMGNEGITLHQSWKENTGKLPLGLNCTFVHQPWTLTNKCSVPISCALHCSEHGHCAATAQACTTIKKKSSAAITECCNNNFETVLTLCHSIYCTSTAFLYWCHN